MTGPRAARIRYETPAPHIARIVLARPEKRNAQDAAMLYELNGAFDRAAHDDDIRVIVLAADGGDFSAGHDLGETSKAAAMEPFDTVGTWAGFHCTAHTGHMAREHELYLGLSERWRNIPKPTIAQVQGRVVAGGLMLIWPCDLIVASEDAVFADNTIAMGVCGAEFFNHPYEVGVRKAKEMLFTSDALNAHEAKQLGMVNHVVATDLLESFTLDLARRIATQPPFAVTLAKQAVNSAQDQAGRPTAHQTAFALHQVSHGQNREDHGSPVDPGFPARQAEIQRRWLRTQSDAIASRAGGAG